MSDSERAAGGGVLSKSRRAGEPGFVLVSKIEALQLQVMCGEAGGKVVRFNKWSLRILHVAFLSHIRSF